ncbi:alpha/beta fold hydrolase [Diaphorobacter sp. HDW4A]|uniref:alpha/beta hydrolase family protein n=1 Tax=Diaphorobacter sp. HDW4A TaxID=2714924 RepID=UPI00140D2511|nr:alpha/beta fold hydrolase [Diaphorobacter sp. HDW4A]QIL81073.1 alpha/beta fold hydrolase [Diaphorobacter sp. HDW4A]
MNATTASAQASPQAVQLTCQDGQVLSGQFLAASNHTCAQLPVLIAPATGVKQHFYLRFARWLAEQGHAVLLFDYRGVGLSLQGPLAQCKASLSEWGQQDQAAAVNWLLQHTGAEQLILVGNSAGAQMLGLLPNHASIARVVGVSSSSGWFGGMPRGFSIKARFGLRCVVPLGVRLLGYAPTSFLGLGENLPAKVGLQWGEWCAAGGYATNAVRQHPEQDFHAQVRMPITILYASDDSIATTATVQDLLRTFPKAPSQSIQIRPQDHGLKDLGHLNWFRQSHQAMWPLMYRAINGHQMQPED